MNNELIASDDERRPDEAEEFEPSRAALLIAEGRFAPSTPEEGSVTLGPDGLVRNVRGMRFEGSLDEWVQRWGAMLSDMELAPRLRESPTCRRGSACLSQMAEDGLPVFNSYLRAQFDEAGALTDVLSQLGRDGEDWRSAVVSADEAARLASEHPIAEAGVVDRGYWIREDGALAPVWRVPAVEGPTFVDALTGEVAARVTVSADLDSQEIYFADTATGPGDPEGWPPLSYSQWDTRWTRVWDNDPAFSAPPPWPGSSALLQTHVGQIRAFMLNRWGRDGWDDNTAGQYHRMRAASDVLQYTVLAFGGAPLVDDYPAHQASWTGFPAVGEHPLQASVIVSPTGNCLDVLGHEFFHGVEENELGQPMNSQYELRAMREGLSDIAGRVMEADYSSTPDWLMRTGGTCTSPVRSMSDPEAPSSAGGGSCSTCSFGTGHYSNFQRWTTAGTTSGTDQEFLYASAGVFDKTAWLAGRESAAGSVNFAGRTVTGIGNVNTALQLYDSVHSHMGPGDAFFDFSVAWRDSAYARWGLTTNYYRAVSATQAVGLWTGSQQELGIDTTQRASFASFTVSGQARTYVAYRQSGGWALNVRYRAGTVWGGGGWSAASQQGFTVNGPALQTHDGQLWLAYRYDLNTNIYVRSMTSAGVWSSSATLPGTPQSDSDIAAAEFGGNLYVFYRVPGTGGISYYRRSAGTWTGPVSTGAVSDSGPAAAVAGGRLYLVYRRGTDVSNLYFRTQILPVTNAFSAESVIPRQSTVFAGPTAAVGTPTVAGYRGRLHVTARSDDGRTRYSSYCYCPFPPCECTYRPHEWTQTVRLPQEAASGDPVLYTDAGNPTMGAPLYLFFPATAGYFWDYKISE